MHTVRPSRSEKKTFTKQSPFLFIGRLSSFLKLNSDQIDNSFARKMNNRRSAKVWDNSYESVIGCSPVHQVNVKKQGFI